MQLGPVNFLVILIGSLHMKGENNSFVKKQASNKGKKEKSILPV
jgi:hypothetical protein